MDFSLLFSLYYFVENRRRVGGIWWNFSSMLIGQYDLHNHVKVGVSYLFEKVVIWAQTVDDGVSAA